MNPTSSKLSALLFAMLLTTGLAGCDKLKSAESHITEAKQLQQKGDINAAIVHLKSAVQKQPDNAESRYLLGSLYNKVGDAKSAEKELSKALSLGYDKNKVIPDLGTALLADAQFQKVLDETQPLAGDNEPFDVSIARGNAFLALDKHNEGKASFERALKTKADHPFALIGLAKYEIMQNRVDAAIQWLDMAMTKNPQDTASRVYKGDLLQNQGKIEEALTLYDQAIKLEPNHVAARINKALIEINQGKFADAKVNLDAARKGAPRALVVSYTQALWEYRQGNYKAAQDALLQVLRFDPNHLPSNLLGGAVQLALGSYAQAEQYLKTYLQQDPDNLSARKLMIVALLRQNQTPKALEWLEPALQKYPTDAQLLGIAGEVEMQAGNFTKASAYFAKASDLDPKSASMRSALGMSQLAQGKQDIALADLEAAVKLDTGSKRAALTLISTLMRLQQYDKALTAVTDLEKTHANDVSVLTLKGNILTAKKDMAGARSAFEKVLTQQPSNMQAITSLVQLDMRENKPDEARKRLESALEKDKKNISIIHALAGFQMGQGKIEQATTLLENASKENPENLTASLVLAEHYLKTGDKDKALKLVQKLQGENSENVQVLDVLGKVLFATGDKNGALDAYSRLASLTPKSGAAHLATAGIYLAMDNLNSAADALKRALIADPNYFDAQRTLAILEAKRGNTTQALRIAQQVQQKNPKFSEGFVLEGDVNLMQKQYAPAAAAYEKAWAIQPEPQLLARLHEAMFRSGKEKAADALLLKWINEHPQEQILRAHLASHYMNTQQYKLSLEQHLILLQQNPRHLPALNNSAWLYQQLKELDKAADTAEKALQLAPKDPRVKDTLAWILLEQGKTERAITLFKEALADAPDFSEVSLHYAHALIKSGDKAGARRVLEKLSTAKNFDKQEEVRQLLKQL